MTKQFDLLLLDYSLKRTEARIALLRILSKNQEPLDVETIEKLLRKQKIFIDHATVYRTLNTFVAKGIVRKVELREGKARFELTALPHHHHAVCVNCGKIKDIGPCDLEAVTRKVVEKFGYKVRSHQLDVFGLCPSCQRLLQSK